MEGARHGQEAALRHWRGHQASLSSQVLKAIHKPAAVVLKLGTVSGPQPGPNEASPVPAGPVHSAVTTKVITWHMAACACIEIGQ